MTDHADPMWRLRPAGPDDCRLYWAWANDREVRAMAFCSEPISWEAHQCWYAAHLASTRCQLFILEDASGVPVGQVRFDSVADDSFEIDISVCAARRGCGVSRALILLGEEALKKTAPVAVLRALIKPQNQPSLALFRSAGYRECGIVSGPTGMPAVLMEKIL